MLTSSLDQQFSSLENQLGGPGMGTLQLRVPAVQGLEVYIGVRKPSNARVCRLEVEHAGFLSHNLPALGGLSVEVQNMEDSGRIRSVLRLVATTPSFNDVFTSLIADLLEVVNNESSSGDAVQAVVDRLFLWQRFLETLRPDGLTAEEQRGLYGELLYLRDNLIQFVGADIAVEAWQGPLGAAQDFQWNSRAVEVKTSVASSVSTVQISNADQLNIGKLQSLHLHCIAICVSTQGQSLLGIISQIRKALSAESGRKLNDKLRLIGYLDIHESHYDINHYIVLEQKSYKVEGDFPRITPADLLPGVQSVSYIIDLALCKEFATTINASLS